jgi:hypothetical protein|tara:strand:+ start:1462 stop:1734 length:273 start_codon:yes stop_codon:yes gene_type:complete
MTKSTFTKTKAQIKSSRYYLFWGAATLAVVAGQVYVGTGYRAMAESMNRWFEETIDIMTIPHTGPGEYYDLDPRKMEPMEMERWGMPIIQ